ncbi:MAG: DNA topoisomerase IV subunit B, partial [Firmicutes bacterium]|nr:DNA topoisomerase IV subunit B [Candidatus Scatoplasma merdavium]
MSKIASKDTRLETGKKDGYNANDMSLLSDLEAVRKRPGMYIGSTDTNGLHHLVWEIVDNAVDEANEGYGNQISVTINTDNSITIEDRGRGVPYDINKETGLSGFEMVYLKLHAGGKFDEKNYKTAGGLHGVGGAVVNALSSWMEVDSYRDGYCHHIRFESAPLKKDKNGEYIDKGEKLVSPISSTPTSKRGTKVTFCPDPSIFSDTSFDYQKIASNLDDRAGLNSGVTFILEDKRTSRKDIFSYKGGLKEY